MGEQLKMIRDALRAGCAVFFLGMAADAVAQEPVKGIVALKESGPVTYGRSAKIKATVEAIDLDARHLKVRGPKGYAMTMRVEERVRNLPEIRVGDEVTIRYNESVGLELRKLGAGETPDAEQSVPAVETEPPSDGRRIISAVVEAVAVKQKTVTLKDDAGNFVDLYVRDTKVLESLEVGERIVAIHSEAAVVSIEPPKPKTKKKKK